MSLVGPNHSNKKSLFIEFNKRVSAQAYSNARDEVLMTKGITFGSEEQSQRTMKVEANSADLAGEIERIRGVERVILVNAPLERHKHRL